VEIPLALEGTLAQSEAGPESFETPLNEEELSESERPSLTNEKFEVALTELSQGQAAFFVCVTSGLSSTFCRNFSVAKVFSGVAVSSNNSTVEVSSANQWKEGILSEGSPATPPPSSDPISTVDAAVHAENSALDRSLVRVEILSAGKPLEGAVVYMSRLRDNRVRELGRTAADGSLKLKVPSEFWGETVTVFHSCCAPRTFPSKLVRQGGESRLRLEVQAGSGFGVLIQHDAYGFLRRFSGFEMLSEEGKLAVSGQDGFALYDGSKTPQAFLKKVLVRGARPSDFFADSKSTALNSAHPLSYVVAPDEVYRPSLAVLETQEGRPYSGLLKNASLRRWRRDFMARLMQQTTLRGLVSTECESRLAAAGESAVAITSHGWAKTHLAGEWDFLLTIDYSDFKGGVQLAAVNHEGESFFAQSNNFSKNSSELPEQISRRGFEEFLSKFPFEGYVLRQNGQQVDLTFANEKDYGLKNETPVAFYQLASTETGQRAVELAALGLIESDGTSSGVRAKVTHWNNRTRKTSVLPDVVKVLKVSAEFYKREAVRSQMAKGDVKKAL
jgi:hypothetical protein